MATKIVFSKLDNNRQVTVFYEYFDFIFYPEGPQLPHYHGVLKKRHPLKTIRTCRTKRFRKRKSKSRVFYSKKTPEQIISRIERLFENEARKTTMVVQICDYDEDLKDKRKCKTKSKTLDITDESTAWWRVFNTLEQWPACVMTKNISFGIEVRNMETRKQEKLYNTFHSYKPIDEIFDVVKKFVESKAEEKRNEIWFQDWKKPKTTHYVIVSSKIYDKSKSFSVVAPGVTNDELMEWVGLAGKYGGSDKDKKTEV